jgi:membrane protease YdiL (CAAX protease family)
LEPENPSELPIPEPPPPDLFTRTSAETKGTGSGGDPAGQNPEPEEPYRGLKWIFVGPHGLRAGWSVLIVACFLRYVGGFVAHFLISEHVLSRNVFAPRQALFGELFQVILLLIAVAIVAAIEQRNLLDYNLRGPHRTKYFLSGLVVGFVALSALVGALSWGGWLYFGPMGLSGLQIVKYAAVWGGVFLLVGCMEEGSMRCYLQFTLTRGLNFWWAAAAICGLCGYLALRVQGNGTWGVYIIATLGFVPCLLLQLNKSRCSGFWQAAWVTSTLFGALHTGNSGENWIGIFAAAFIGFVFCVSIWVTGSAWWAIGCHAAWDWAETYFYGTADSGFVAPGHLLTTSTSGKPLWSGGTDGPEGSILVIPIVLLILAWLLVVYRRPRPTPMVVSAGEESLAS